MQYEELEDEIQLLREDKKLSEEEISLLEEASDTSSIQAQLEQLQAQWGSTLSKQNELVEQKEEQILSLVEKIHIHDELLN